MMAGQITLQDFINARGLRLSAKPADRNPHMDDSDSMDHWRCTIRAPKGKTMRVYFSKGVGHHGAEPTLAEVLDCLASDSAGVANTSFEEWCGEYGYDTDSRKALRTYRVCDRQAERLKDFLGSASFEELLWNVERL